MARTPSMSPSSCRGSLREAIDASAAESDQLVERRGSLRVPRHHLDHSGAVSSLPPAALRRRRHEFRRRPRRRITLTEFTSGVGGVRSARARGIRLLKEELAIRIPAGRRTPTASMRGGNHHRRWPSAALDDEALMVEDASDAAPVGRRVPSGREAKGSRSPSGRRLIGPRRGSAGSWAKISKPVGISGPGNLLERAPGCHLSTGAGTPGALHGCAAGAHREEDARARMPSLVAPESGGGRRLAPASVGWKRDTVAGGH